MNTDQLTDMVIDRLDPEVQAKVVRLGRTSDGTQEIIVNLHPVVLRVVQILADHDFIDLATPEDERAEHDWDGIPEESL